jgi:hypothetical protein
LTRDLVSKLQQELKLFFISIALKQETDR